MKLHSPTFWVGIASTQYSGVARQAPAPGGWWVVNLRLQQGMWGELICRALHVSMLHTAAFDMVLQSRC